MLPQIYSGNQSYASWVLPFPYFMHISPPPPNNTASLASHIKVCGAELQWWNKWCNACADACIWHYLHSFSACANVRDRARLRTLILFILFMRSILTSAQMFLNVLLLNLMAWFGAAHWTLRQRGSLNRQARGRTAIIRVLPSDLMVWTRFMKHLLAQCLLAEQSTARVGHAQRPHSVSSLVRLRSGMSQYGFFYLFFLQVKKERCFWRTNNLFNQRNPPGLW